MEFTKIVDTRKAKMTRPVLQSPGRKVGTPKIILEGMWVHTNLGWRVGEPFTINLLENGDILLSKNV
jgi:hypothetical protein